MIVLSIGYTVLIITNALRLNWHVAVSGQGGIGPSSLIGQVNIAQENEGLLARIRSQNGWPALGSTNGVVFIVECP